MCLLGCMIFIACTYRLWSRENMKILETSLVKVKKRLSVVASKRTKRLSKDQLGQNIQYYIMV